MGIYTYALIPKIPPNFIKYILLTLNKSSNAINKTPLGENGCLSLFFWGYHPVSLALHPGFSDLWRPPPALSSILTLGFFFECLGIQFFNSSHGTYGTPYHARGHSHSSLGKQRISLGVTIILGLCLYSHT